MQDITFAPELNLTTQFPDELKGWLDQHRTQEVDTFTGTAKHQLVGSEFLLESDGKTYRFTNAAYSQFCSVIGIPPVFANKIPNDLLVRNVEEMLVHSQEKVKLLVRDTNVISNVVGDNFIYADPIEFQEAGESLKETHLFREASLTDRGVGFFYEPLKESTITPFGDRPDDRFNVGINFNIGFESGLVTGMPYSLRHCCINVAVHASEVPHYILRERMRKRRGQAAYHHRLLENYTTERYQVYLGELSKRIERAVGPISDLHYVGIFRPLGRVLSKDVALAVMGIGSEQHDSIMEDVRYRASKSPNPTPVPLEEINRFDLFNNITAAAKGYVGSDRMALQQIGGMVLESLN